MQTIVTVFGWIFIGLIAVLGIREARMIFSVMAEKRRNKQIRETLSQFGTNIQIVIHWISSDKYRPFRPLIDYIIECAKDKGGSVDGLILRKHLDTIIENQNKEQ